MHLYISVSYFVCAVSRIRSLGCASLIWHDINTLSSPFTLNAIKIRIILMETDVLHATVRVAVTSLPVLLAIKGSARNQRDVRLTGRSPIRAGHAKYRPIPITGRSIGASLIITIMRLWLLEGNFISPIQAPAHLAYNYLQIHTKEFKCNFVRPFVSYK